MSSNPYAHFSGVPMDSDDIDDLLTAQGYGILSLCGDGAPYSIPISFGYDGEDVYFGMLVDSGQPTKMEYIEDGTTVRLLVTEIRGRFDWRSIAITGPVSAIERDTDEWDRCIDSLVDNGWFMRAFERASAIESVEGWKLRTDELRGLERTEQA